VSNAPAGAAINSGSSNSEPRQRVELNQNQFKYISLSTNLKPVNSGSFFGSLEFWSLLSFPFILVLLGVLLGKKREALASDIIGNKMKKANKLARKYLSEAKRNIGDQKAFYLTLERALHNYLKAKLHIQTKEMSKERIRELLAERNAKPETTKDFIALIESCEFARYTPSSNVEMQRDYENAARVISELDKQL
jgi:intergrase/recombinase